METVTKVNDIKMYNPRFKNLLQKGKAIRMNIQGPKIDNDVVSHENGL